MPLSLGVLCNRRIARNCGRNIGERGKPAGRYESGSRNSEFVIIKSERSGRGLRGAHALAFAVAKNAGCNASEPYKFGGTVGELPRRSEFEREFVYNSARVRRDAAFAK